MTRNLLLKTAIAAVVSTAVAAILLLGARLLDADESARKGSGGGEMGG
jgi:hypothetical protein